MERFVVVTVAWWQLISWKHNSGHQPVNGVVLIALTFVFYATICTAICFALSIGNARGKQNKQTHTVFNTPLQFSNPFVRNGIFPFLFAANFSLFLSSFRLLCVTSSSQWLAKTKEMETSGWLGAAAAAAVAAAEEVYISVRRVFNNVESSGDWNQQNA